MKNGLFGLMVVGLLAISAAPAQGQVAWESPMLLGPASPAGWGVFLVDPSPRSGIGVLTTFRSADAPAGLGYRLGLAEGARDRLAVYGGIDVSGFLVRHSPDFPLDVIWLAGAGFGAGDHFRLGFPLGAAIGRMFDADGVVFHPYAAPRVVLDAFIGRDRPDDNLDLALVVDLGIDVAFQPNWAVRFGASVGDRSALAIGMSFRVF